MNKNYRIHTNITTDSLLQVNMRQDFDFMEILSLKLSQKDAYKIHSSNYGVIIGRVLANDAFGIPNAKVSVFIERDDTDTTDIENIYPYKEISGKDNEGRRYNLLPDYSDDECYRVVGTFPNKRLLLDDTTYLEVYDKYWKYSTVTNNAGDYMIFGIPVGNQQIHVDIDMSDIGVLSQKPRDYMYKGYTETLFDSSTQFKSSTNLDNLTQIFSQNQSVYVYPFWGDAENGIAAITRADIQINYKFEPTCVFMGSIVSDNDGNNIDHKCGSTMHSGFNNQLVAGEGTIEMIRKTQDGLVEEYPIQGNRLIDSDGVWCYQIPMNLDFVGTDEYGNIVPTDNPSKGIPTRTQVRFRISKNETGGEGFSRHTAKYLVPMNPVLDEGKVVPTTKEKSGQDMEKMYLFGSNTPQSCFRDLYWNNVYSVKNFIPKTQVARRAYSPYYNALKACNTVDNQNPIPFNKLMINIPFTYMFICLLFTIVVEIINFVNKFIINPINEIIRAINGLKIFGWHPFHIGYLGCMTMQAGSNAENVVYAPGCNQTGRNHTDCPEDMDSCTIVNDKKKLMDVIQQNLSQEYDVVRLDLYQDWINGCLYMPLWFWKKAKKKKFLFFTVKRAKNEFCDCDKKYSRLKTRYTCNIVYNSDSLKVDLDSLDPSEDKWHKRREKGIWFKNGLIKGVTNNENQTAYYYSGFQPSSNDSSDIDDIKQRRTSFEFVRLFATDIILLGNLNESNIYGIPQLFNNLPSTTSNIPPIATIEESVENVDEDDDFYGNDLAEREDGGTTITTGMDWGYAGADDSPVYKNGLFLDLACFYADTRAKACINVERLSELGVNLDMSYKMEYGKGNDLVEGVIDSDGFVNKFELNDNDTRAMFATLNHVGFIPQDYQTDKGMYETQVMDERTGYLVPKFKYTYPVDFDGRMQPIMDDYSNGFVQPLFDAKDESYLTFRLGAESGNGVHGRRRHFYYNNGDTFEMPLYNNSFYFYFGINKGNTAIDKFYSKFVAPCTKNDKKPFTIDITTQGKVECREMYNIEEYKDPYINVAMDDIQAPYSYELLDSNNNSIIVQTGQTDSEFRLPDPNNKHTSGVSITNQHYTLKVTDANGKKLSERLNVDTPRVSIDYETQRLGTKFYNITETRVDYICSDQTEFYGILRVKSFTIDGYPFNITKIEPIGYDDTTNSYVVKLTGINNLQQQVDDHMENVFDNGSGGTNLNQVILYVSTIENKTSQASSGGTDSGSTTTNGVRNCLCDKNNPVAITQGANPSISTALQASWAWLGSGSTEEEFLEPEFYVYQPNTFLLTVSQWCNDQVVSSNTTSEMAVIQNGENFNAFLDNMPVRFMLGTNNDNINGTVMNKSNFYRTDVVENPNYDGINGWYGVHQEDTYKFPSVDERNRVIWDDYVTLKNGITSSDAKKKILKYKFETMFSVSEATYVTTNSSLKHAYRAEGGVGIPLNRMLAPAYDSSSLGSGSLTYTLSDRGSVTCDESYPNIVGNNYKGYTDKDSQPYFNENINCNNDHKRQGNYFAVFSNNGGYINNKEIDPSIPVIKSPNFAKVSLVNPTKQIGKDVKGLCLSNVSAVYKKEGDSLPYFRAMFVDRRLDFNLYILAPSTGRNIRLYPLVQAKNGQGSPMVDDQGNPIMVNDPRENVWKGGRISGVTYGGIEMSYDDEYNILSADTTDDNNSVTKNNKLEYTMAYSNNAGEDAKTYFNENPEQTRRLYEAELNGVDIRDYFWSNSRKAALTAKVNDTENSLRNGNIYFYKYPKDTTGLYNGDFSRRTVIKSSTNTVSNYPTKRYIDVGNLPMVGGASSMYLASCGYNMRPSIDSQSKQLSVTATRGETLDYEFNFQRPVTMMEPSSENETFGNVEYKVSNTTNGWTTMVSDIANVMFRINTFECNGFNVYNHSPKIIRVLPYIDGIDGISYYKTVTNNGNEDAGLSPEIYKSRGTLKDKLDARNDDLVLYEFRKVGDRTLRRTFLSFVLTADTITSEDVEYKDWYWDNTGKKRQGKFLIRKDTGDNPQVLKSDDNEWNSITFARTISLGEDTRIFTVLLERDFESSTKDNLTKQIKTVETGDLYDARPLIMQLDSGNTYVQMSTMGVNTDVTTDTAIVDEEDEPLEEEAQMVLSADSTGQVHIQTFSFKFKFSLTADPVNAQCEAFSDIDTMSYTFTFTNANNESFSLYPYDVSPIDEECDDNTYVIGMKIKWSQDMGIAADNAWYSNINLTILGKTKDGFVYKIPNLKYKFDSFADGSTYDPSSKTSTGMDDGQPHITKLKFTPYSN